MLESEPMTARVAVGGSAREWRMSRTIGPMSDLAGFPPPIGEPRADAPDRTSPDRSETSGSDHRADESSTGWAWDIPLADPTPTGEIRIIESAPDEAPSDDDGSSDSVIRHRSPRLMLALAILLPLLLLFAGLAFISLSLGGGKDSPARSTATTSPEVATRPATTVPIVGDPIEAASAQVAAFVTLLQAHDWEAAAAMTQGTRTHTDVEVAYGNLANLQHLVVSRLAIGPNRYRVRLVVFSLPASGAATARCEQWDVDPSAVSVRPGDGAVKATDRTTLESRGPDLMNALSAWCGQQHLG